MSCEDIVEVIDSNIVGLHFAEEICLKTLAGENGADAVWWPLEPNEFSDFGGEITTLVRAPLSSGRQEKKGVVTDLEASGGFSQDLTQTNLKRLMQGFMFADARERPRTAPVSGSAATTVVLEDFTPGPSINLRTGDGAKFAVGMILKTSGMKVAGNNKNKIIVTAIAGDVLTTDQTFFAEVVDVESSLEVVGYQFAAGTLSVDFTAGTARLLSSGVSFLTMGFNIGEWIFIGGDGTNFRFANNDPGFARIRSFTADALTLEELTFLPITEPGGTLTIQLFCGDYLRNEKDQLLIKKRSYHLERTLGQDDDGIQSEYLVGAVPNEFTLNINTADKLTCDLTFVAMDNQVRNGAEGLKPGDRSKSLPIENAFNTSSDIYQMRLFVHDKTVPTPSSLFAVSSEASITINNNVRGLKGIGHLGSFNVSAGTFSVSGSISVYFVTVEAVRAIRANADVGWNLIATKDNLGFVYDIPLLSVSGGRADIVKDEPIMLPLEKMAAENEYGYTLSITYFGYLPDVAMSDK